MEHGIIKERMTNKMHKTVMKNPFLGNPKTLNTKKHLKESFEPELSPL